MANNFELEKTISFLSQSWGEAKPEVGLICGSGWGELSEIFEESSALSYEVIPGMSSTTIAGHEGNLILSKFLNKQILVFQGRRHFYEGAGWGPICFPVHLAHSLGIKTMVLTNAAGGINDSFKVGDLMVLEDHINFMGTNPLIGPTANPEIPRFPDQTEIYNKKLQNRIMEVAKENNFLLKKGIYLGLTGPAFETPAEIKAFRQLGVDAVGMSTVPEAMLCNALSIKTVAVSCISNLASGIATHKLSHEDVQNASEIALPKMKKLIHLILTELLG